MAGVARAGRRRAPRRLGRVRLRGAARGRSRGAATRARSSSSSSKKNFAAAGIKRPNYNITGWVILTLVQHATEEQVARWVRPALDQQVIWCQLFSEPEAGSDAAGVKTRATKVDGGWMINGQKVWTSGAHLAGFGMATVRTNTDVPKHQGITTMVIDMHAPGVTVRPLRMTSGRFGLQRGVLRRRLRARRRRGRPDRRRLDGGPGHPRQRERQHRRGTGRALSIPLETLVEAVDAQPGAPARRCWAGSAVTSPARKPRVR